MNAAGDGGLVVTNNNELIESIKNLKNHGQTARNRSNRFGFVSRLDSIQAVILNLRLDLLDSTINQRRSNSELYNKHFQDLNIQIPINSQEIFHSYHLYVIELDNRDKIQKSLGEMGVETKIHYPILIVDQEAYRAKYPTKKWYLPTAKKQSRRILSLPIHQNLSEVQIEYVTKNLAKLV